MEFLSEKEPRFIIPHERITFSSPVSKFNVAMISKVDVIEIMTFCNSSF